MHLDAKLNRKVNIPGKIMSVSLAIQPVRLQSVSNTVTVQLIDGSVTEAVRVATYQIDASGRSILVLNSIRFESTHDGSILNISNVVNAPTSISSTRVWFWSVTGAPIYIDNGIFYSANGDIYEGDVTSYQATTTTNNITSKITVSSVWCNFPETANYLAITRVSNTAIAPNNTATVVNSWIFDNDTFTVPTGATIVENLPPCVYRSRHTNDIPTDFPISGFAASWITLYPTLEAPEPAELLIDDATYNVSGSTELNSEEPLGVVIPPAITHNANVILKSVFRIRISPIIITALPAFPQNA